MLGSRSDRFILLLLGVLLSDAGAQIDLSFPPGFLIGAGSSAYQIEGAWDLGNKSESIWDFHTNMYPDKILDLSTGHVSIDHYHNYKEDIELMKDIGLNHYSFSLSWPRLFSDRRTPNPEGVRFYHGVLDELRKKDIMPMVTLYHWDHPQYFEQLFGGWLGEEMAYAFAEYARFVFREFGGKVKLFATIDEAHLMCKHAYGLNVYPPSTNQSGYADYRCIHNMLKAHAMAYHIYNKEFRDEQRGQVGIVIDSSYFYGKNGDYESADLAYEFEGGLIAHPIFSAAGDYSDAVKRQVAARCCAQGLKRSRLPEFSQGWVEYIKGSADFFGLTHYTSKIVEPLSCDHIMMWPNDEGLLHSAHINWTQAQSKWLNVVPEGLGDLLRMIKYKYNNPPVYIIKNGVPDEGDVDDVLRMRYFHDYMKEMLIAMKRDNCNVKAYTAWSLFDSFEWDQGYTKKFGLVRKVFDSGHFIGYQHKQSSRWLLAVLKTRRLQPVKN